MANRNSTPTMKDVAREAGVALGTVSKVVNGVRVGDEYRIRVEKAIKKLNYRVNTYAKGLKSGKSYAIAVLVPNLISPYFSKLVNSLGRAIAARNQHMVVFSTDYDPIREQYYMDIAQREKVDGIICLSYNPDLQVPEDISFVSIDRYFGVKIPCVSCDNYGGGYLAAEKFKENGCKRVAMLRVASNLPHEPAKRRDGFVAGCEAMKIDYDLKILRDGTRYEEFTEFLHEHFHNGKLDYDGLFCGTDALAYQIRRTLSEMGLSVPKDVQIIGFDGIRVFGDLELTCSTIEQPVDAIAEACVNIVMDDTGHHPSLMCLPVHYVYGGTTYK